MMFLFVFFVEQKTAYAMRISDWSSDVCSSDLPSNLLAWLNGRRRALPLVEQRLERRWNIDTTLGRPSIAPDITDDLLLVLKGGAMVGIHCFLIGAKAFDIDRKSVV